MFIFVCVLYTIIHIYNLFSWLRTGVGLRRLFTDVFRISYVRLRRLRRLRKVFTWQLIEHFVPITGEWGTGGCGGKQMGSRGKM